ncbi:hypothetical protein CEXT_246191 [Caerostris extrusa]|uniref:Uncharacterized protein n=1 Tax=Caerostris extrusa TaxID=172846 RepID=A0AAV4TNE2_CAEEX|nr:hypothetical protein CEXT_246191 [Caerostris extrusa]
MKEAQLTVSNSFPGALHGIGKKISNHYQHHRSNRGKKTDRGISTSKHIDFEDSDATLEVPTTSPRPRGGWLTECLSPSSNYTGVY